jgi:hypothetical protein
MGWHHIGDSDDFAKACIESRTNSQRRLAGARSTSGPTASRDCLRPGSPKLRPNDGFPTLIQRPQSDDELIVSREIYRFKERPLR